MPQDKSIINVASGGVLVAKTLEDASYLITNIAENSKQFGTRVNAYTKHVNKVSSSNLESQIQALSSSQKEHTSLIRSLMYGDAISQARFICSMNDHTAEFCPHMHEEQVAQVDVVGGSNFNLHPR
jgi:ABC-type iron transport system FetAB ATPase subunit